MPLKSKVLGSSILKPLQVFCLALTTLATQAAPTHLGDLDEDNVFTAQDLAKLVAHTSGATLLPDNLKPFADINQDGVINDTDHSALVNLILETATPQSLPLASVAATSPHNGEGEVAVTRETVLRFSMPLGLGSFLDTTQLYAEYGGRKLLSRVDLSSDRKKATLFYLETLPSKARIKITFAPVGLTDLLGRAIDPDGDGEAGGVYTSTFDTLSITGLAGTGITGQVLASEVGAGGADVPVVGAFVTVDGAEETLRAVTDAQGHFTLSPCPAGSFFVHVDARFIPTSGYPSGDYYPAVGKRWDAEAGRMDNLSGNIHDTSRGKIYLPKIKAGSLAAVSPTEETQISFPGAVTTQFPALAGTHVDVPPNSLFADDGTRGGLLGIAPVDGSRLPSPLPPGLQLPMVITIQTDGGSNFDIPVPVTFPNLPDPETGVKLPPGAKSALFSFNHDTGEWEVVGPMTVTEDGNFVKTDAGVGVRQPGWHGNNPGSGAGGPGDPGAPPGTPNGPSVGDPGAPPPPPCGPGFKEPQSPREVRELMNQNANNAGLGILGHLIKMLSGSPRGATGLAKLGKGARKHSQAMDRIMADAHAYRVYLEQMRDFYAEYEDGQGPGRPPLPCTPQTSSKKASAVTPMHHTSGTWGSELDSMITSYEMLGGNIRIQLALEVQIEDIYAGKPEGYVPTALEKTRLEGLEAQIKTHLNGRNVHDFYEPMWADLRGRIGTSVSTQTTSGGIQSRGNAFFVVLREDNDQVVQRGRTSAGGALPNLILTPDTNFVVRFFYPSTFSVAETSFNSGPTGSQATLLYPGISAATGADIDRDGDGLSDLAESVIGTNPILADTDNDHISDSMEIRQGTDPASGMVSSTGVLATVPTTGPAIDIAARNNIVVTANGLSGISVFNVSAGLNPVRITDIDTPGDAISVAVSGNWIAVADRLSGLAVVDISNLADVRLLGHVNIGSGSVEAQVVTISGPTAYVAMSNSTVVAVDLVSRTVLQRLPIPGNQAIYDLAIWREHLYVLQPGRVATVNLTTFETDALVPLSGQIITAWRPRLFAGEGTLYAGHGRGFHILDTAANEASPPVLQNFETNFFGWKQLVSNGSGLGLSAAGINSPISDPHPVQVYNLGAGERQPVFTTTIQTPGVAHAISLFNGVAYVADGSSGLGVMAYLPFDTQSQNPTIALSSNIPLNPTTRTGSAESGKLLRLSAAVTDDVQVRNVEFYIDGVLASVDGNYPFEHRFVTPKVSLAKPSFRVRAKATDTGGNSAWSPEFTITLVPDTTPPVVTKVAPNGLTGKVTGVFAYMSEALDPATVGTETFTLIEAGSDRSLGTGDDVTVTAASIAFRSEIQAAVFSTAADLPPGTYRATLTSGVKDLSNNALAANRTWEFNVEGDPVFWVGTGSGNWNTAANWSSGVVPTANDLAVINAPAGTNISLNNAYITARAVSVEGGARLVLTDGIVNIHNVTLGSDIFVGARGQVNLYNVTLNNARIVYEDANSSASKGLMISGSLSGTGEIVCSENVRLYVEMQQASLGAGITARIRGEAYFDKAYYWMDPYVNYGQIITEGGTAYVSLEYCINEGIIRVQAGRTCFKTGCDNNGTLEVSGAGRLELGEYGSDITLADIGNIVRSGSGGKVIMMGWLQLGQETLALTAATGNWELEGHIIGGHLTTAGGATLVVGNDSSYGDARLKGLHIQGTVTLLSGSTLRLEDNWINDGTITGTNGRVLLSGEFELSEIGNYTGTDNSVEIIGTLDNTGKTLMLDALPTFVKIGDLGTIKGGNISGSAPVTITNARWKLDGVTLKQDLRVNGIEFDIYRGLTLDNADILALGGSDYGGAQLTFYGVQTLGGTGSLDFSQVPGHWHLRLRVYQNWDAGGNPPTPKLTIGAQVAIHAGLSSSFEGGSGQLENLGTMTFPVTTPSSYGNYNAYVACQLINRSTISIPAGHVRLMGYDDYPWRNEGVINLSGTGILSFGNDLLYSQLGTINRTGGSIVLEGDLDNEGKVLALTATTGDWELRDGVIKGGSVTTTGGAKILVPAQEYGTLDGVSLQGTLEVQSGYFDFKGDWTNLGIINATNSDVSFGGEFHMSDLGVINRTGGRRIIRGVLDNTGQTFVYDPPGDAWLFFDGEVKGGTLTSTGTPEAVWGQQWTLNGVTLGSDISRTGSAIYVKNGLNLAGHTLALLDSQLTFEGTQTVGSTGGTIRLATQGWNSTSVYVQPDYDTTETTAVVTFHDSLLMHFTQTGSIVAYNPNSIINRGIIRVDGADTRLYKYGNVSSQGPGQIELVNGGQIINNP